MKNEQPNKKIEKSKNVSEKKKFKTMDCILILIGCAVLIFVAIMIWLFIKFQSIPDTLCTSFFMAVVGECGGMSWIKTSKERATERMYQLEDEKRNKKNQEDEEVNIEE